MPIIEVKAYSVGQLVFPTLQEAQIKEILDLAQGDRPPSAPPPDEDVSWARFIVDHTDEIVSILTCQPRTKKVRSDKGTKRKKP